MARHSFFACLWLCLCTQVLADIWDDFDQQIRQRNYQEAAKLIQPIAANKDPRACYELAQLYRNGIGVSKDALRSRELLIISAQQGFADGQYLLGVYYHKGIGGDSDDQQALKWLQLANAQHHAKAAALQEEIMAGGQQPTAQQDLQSLLAKGDLKALQKYSQNLQYQDSNGNHLFALAVQQHQRKIAEWLYRQGLDINDRNRHSENAVHLLVEQPDQALLTWLISIGANINQANKAGKTPLHIAVEKSDPTTAAQLLSAGADAHVRDKKGQSAIDKVWYKQQPQMLSLFKQWHLQPPDSDNLDQRLAAVTSDEQSDAALLIAIERGDLKLLKALLQQNPHPWQQNTQGHTLITWAAQQKQAQILQYLLSRSQGQGLIGPLDRNAFFFAISSTCLECLSILRHAGVDPLQTDQEQQNSIDFALASSSELSLPLIQSINKQVWQPHWLPLAARQGLLDVVTVLSQSGIQLNRQDSDGRTALWYASQQMHSGIIELLLKRGADMSVADSDGNTPLHIAAQTDHALAVLLANPQSRALLDLGNRQGSTALHLAADAGKATNIKALIDHGASKDPRDNNGNTPLILAVTAHQADAVSQLLKAGAALNRRNNNKQDADNIARQLHYSDIVALLQQARDEQGFMSIFK